MTGSIPEDRVTRSFSSKGVDKFLRVGGWNARVKQEKKITCKIFFTHKSTQLLNVYIHMQTYKVIFSSINNSEYCMNRVNVKE